MARMKCPNCGKALPKKAKFCPKCGSEIEMTPVKVKVVAPLTPIGKVAQVFFYVGAIFTCCTVIGLCWALPMIHIYKRGRDVVGKHSIGFKVCTIIFISRVAGILMFIDYKH